MMQQWKRSMWAALLTLATLFSFTGCSSSDDESSESSVDLSNIASAMITEGTTEALTTDYAYIMNDDGTISVSGYTGSDTDLTVPGLIDGYVVTGIADHAFEANADIKSITLPNGLITIGESAFSDCSSLNGCHSGYRWNNSQRCIYQLYCSDNIGYSGKCNGNYGRSVHRLCSPQRFDR